MVGLAGGSAPSRATLWLAGLAAGAGLLVLLLAAATSWSAPERSLAPSLMRQLAAARSALAAGTADLREPCDLAGDARMKLYGQPGVDRQRAPWKELESAAQAVQAACGQLRLAQTPGTSGRDAEQARESWRGEAQADLRRACASLRQAAERVGEPGPSCAE